MRSHHGLHYKNLVQRSCFVSSHTAAAWRVQLKLLGCPTAEKTPDKSHNPGVRDMGNLPFKPKQLLIALVYVDLKTLISSIACGYLCTSPLTFPNHAKNKLSHPRTPLTLSSNLTATPCQQQSLPAPLALQLCPSGTPLRRGVAHGSQAGQCCAPLGRVPARTGEIQGREAAAKGKSCRKAKKLRRNRYIVA